MRRIWSPISFDRATEVTRAHLPQHLLDLLGIELLFEQFDHLALAVAHLFGALLHLEITPLENLVSLLIELLQKTALPFRPDIGTDRLDVSERQQIEHFEIFAHPHAPGNLEDQLVVVQIAALGGMRQDADACVREIRAAGCLRG